MTPRDAMPDAGPATDRLRQLVEAAWGGYERPEDDPGILRAVADWMDRLDDVVDAWLDEPTVNRGMQADLRRIAIEREASAPLAVDAQGLRFILDMTTQALNIASIALHDEVSDHYSASYISTMGVVQHALEQARAALAATPEAT